MTPQPPISTLFPYTTLFRSSEKGVRSVHSKNRKSMAVELDAAEVISFLNCLPEWSSKASRARAALEGGRGIEAEEIDRKSTRLNSSHVENSYAVFCLKKKKK